MVSNWDFNALFGAGGVLSTTEDLVKLANAQFNFTNKELELTRKQTFEMNENFRMGLGWHILKSENGNDLFWHNGGTGGYSSSMTIDLKNKRAVIILVNVENINKTIEGIGLELINVK
jgi:CubicO group peptidase (beta-lactamase class C family)